MTSLQAYNNFLLEANKDDTNSNIHVPRGKFVSIFNKEARKWTKEKFKRKLSSDELDELSDLLVDNVELEKVRSHIDHFDYKLPEDYYSLASSFSIASKGKCERVLDNWKAKPHDVPILLRDSNNKPSFEFEETILNISSNNVKVYFDDFQIKKVYLNYYKLPTEIDVEGYIKVDGSASSSINPKLNDLAVDEIISRCVLELNRSTQNLEGFQLSKDRTNTEE